MVVEALGDAGEGVREGLGDGDEGIGDIEDFAHCPVYVGFGWGLDSGLVVAGR